MVLIRVWQLTVVFGFTAALTPGASFAEEPAKAGGGKAGLLHLKVDFAAPAGKESREPIPATAGKGWWHWVIPDWDFYRTDLKWENGASNYPAGGPGIAGSGVHAAITCHYEGIMTVYVAGMRRYLAGGIQPEKEPVYDSLCNTWIAGSDFPRSPGSDLLLAFYDLPAGKYLMLSYHNCFNGQRFGDDPTGVEYTQAIEPEPPMSSIKVYPVNTLIADYFKSPSDASNKIVVSGKEGTGKVKQTRQARNVVIQQVKADSELKPSVIEFTTDGSPLVVVYSGGCCKSDDLRPHRKGGYAVLNAFELIQLTPAASGTASRGGGGRGSSPVLSKALLSPGALTWGFGFKGRRPVSGRSSSIQGPGELRGYPGRRALASSVAGPGRACRLLFRSATGGSTSANRSARVNGGRCRDNILQHHVETRRDDEDN